MECIRTQERANPATTFGSTDRAKRLVASRVATQSTAWKAVVASCPPSRAPVLQGGPRPTSISPPGDVAGTPDGTPGFLKAAGTGSSRRRRQSERNQAT